MKNMNRLNWDDLRLFLALAREGTLSGAARHLDTGIATVSRRIERMENALNLPLFLRHQFGYTLTDQGIALLAQAEAVELAIHHMQAKATEETQIRGLVRLASIESLIAPFIVPALAPLLAAHPGLDVEILYSTATVNLHRHDADLALRMVAPKSGNLRLRQVAVMGFGLYGPPDGSVPKRYVTWPESTSLSFPLRWASAFGADGSPRLYVNTLSGQIAAVQAGIGTAIMPHLVARQAGLHLLSARLPDGGAMERPLFLVSHADLASSRRILAVAETLVTSIAARRRELAGA